MTSDAVVTRAEPAVDAVVEWARTVTWESVPAATREMMKRELLDYLGAAIAGRAVIGMPPWLAVLAGAGGRPEASVIGGPRVPATTAALCNGYFGHVLEYDDTHDEAVLHAGAAAIPAALAVAQRARNASGRALCEAALVGIELTCRLGLATRLNLVEGGWIYTSLLGHFGAALAAARLVDRRAETMRNALGIVYCLASGNHQSTRECAPTKHLQPGFAASNGVLAALMASEGLQGVQQPLGGEDGLSRVYLRGRFDMQGVLDRLGERYETDRLSFKPYPTCRLTHPAVSAALRLRAELGEQAAHADQVELVIGPQAHDVVGRAVPQKLEPATRMAAQFSVQWSVAAALLYGELTPAQLLAEVPPSERLARLISRIRCAPDHAAAERDVGGCVLTAHGAFGERKVRETHAKGSPDNPLTEAELLAKFTANTRLAGLSAAGASGLARAILDLDDAPSLSRLGAQLERILDRRERRATAVAGNHRR